MGLSSTLLDPSTCSTRADGCQGRSRTRSRPQTERCPPSSADSWTLRRGVAEPHFHLTTGGQFTSFSSRSCHGEEALDHHRPCCRWASLYLCRDRWPWTRALVVEGERWRRNEAWRPRFLRCPQRNQRRDFGAIRGLLYMARPASDVHGGSLSDVRAGTGDLCKGGDEGKRVATIAASVRNACPISKRDRKSQSRCHCGPIPDGTHPNGGFGLLGLVVT